MKRIEFHFTKETYADLIHKTAKLLGRPYMQVFKMLEKWEPSQVDHLYSESINRWEEKGYRSPAHMWWTERGKKEGKKYETRRSY
jgi:hypothetical protein